MNWLSSLLVLAAIGGANLQCVSNNDKVAVNPNNIPDISSVNTFSLELSKHLLPRIPTGNCFFSPYNVWSGLVLTYFGSAGNTLQELEQVLRLTNKQSTLQLWRGLDSIYGGLNNAYDLTLKTHAWVGGNVEMRPCMQTLFPNTFSLSSLMQEHAQASQQISGWMNQINLQKQSFANPIGVLNNQMILGTIANLNSQWRYAFDAALTMTRDFNIGQQIIQAEIMAMNRLLKYGVSQQLGCSGIELPFAGDGLSMYVFLPKQLDHFAKTVNADVLTQFIASMTPTSCDVQIPKFKIDSHLDGVLKAALNGIGIKNMFTAGADFSQLALTGSLVVQKTLHNANILFNEVGVMPTGVLGLSPTGGKPIAAIGANPTQFHCNRPFMFIIRDNSNNNILFVGSVKNPVI